MSIDRRLVIGGIVVAGGGLAYYLYKKNKAAQAATSTASQTNQYGYGYGYGSQQPGYYGYGYGYGSSGGFGGGGFGGGGYGGYGGTGTPSQYGYGYGIGTGTAGGTGTTTVTTNAQWSEAAVSALTAQGYDGTSVMAALGQYIMGGNLTSNQQGIVSAAISIEGYPPQSGPNGYPPAMNTSAQSGQSSGGVTPPQPGGGTTPAQAGAISNLQPTQTTKTSFTVRWNPVPNATGYSWAVTEMNGTHVKSGTGRPTTVSVNGLHPGWTYNFGVQALPGGPGDNIHVRTNS